MCLSSVVTMITLALRWMLLITLSQAGNGPGAAEASLGSRQPVVSKYLELDLKRVLLNLDERNLIVNLEYLFNNVSSFFSSCMVKSEVEWREKKKYPVHLTNLCGSLGNFEPAPIMMRWFIPILHQSTAIKFTLVYLNLPFIGLKCKYSYINIGGTHQTAMCGKKVSQMDHLFQCITHHHSQ